MTLLTIDDIAAMVKLSRVYVRDRLVKQPDFPRPALVLSQKNKRWSAEDVNYWIGQQLANQQR